MSTGRTAYALERGGSRLAIVLIALVCTIATAFTLTLPALTGRIVDQANIIPAATRSAIEQKLADLEAKSSIQLVVATVASLEGQEIEPYANELFRNWKLGEKTKNNGVLLIVAPKERRVRIEVGYGLEGVLTDALSNEILQAQVLPKFRAGNMPGGVVAGADALIAQLSLPDDEAKAQVAAATRAAAAPKD